MAKKSKGFRSLLKQQKLINRGEAALNNFEKKFQRSEIVNSFADVVKSPKGEVKMSEVLEEFVEPYLFEVHGPERRQMVFDMAVVAWNLAIMPEAERKSAMADLFDDLMKNQKAVVRQDLDNLIAEMITRKLELFPNNRRYIVDFQLEGDGDQFHLSVASTLVR